MKKERDRSNSVTDLLFNDKLQKGILRRSRVTATLEIPALPREMALAKRY